jgi:hypothetical protein
MLRHRCLMLVLTAAMLLGTGLTGCTGGRPALGTAPGPGTQQLAGPLSALPAPQQLAPRLLPRSGAFVPADLYSSGAGYEDELPHNRVARAGDAASLSPHYPAGGVNGLAYAVYRFSVAGYSGPPQLHLRWQGLPPEDGVAFAGLGDFAAGRWDWRPIPYNGELDLGDMAPYLAGAGNLLLVLAVQGETAQTVASLRLGDVDLFDVLLLDRRVVAAPYTVQFDASHLLPNGGTVVNYEWDLDGNGSYELDTDASAYTSHLYTSAATLTPGVRLTLAEGLQATAQASLRVLDGVWETYALTPPPDSAFTYGQPCLANVGGRAAVAYMRFEHKTAGEVQWTEQSIHYTYADAALSASGWSAPATAVAYNEDSAHLSLLPSLADVGGQPAICYNTTASQLCYLRASDALGANWPASPVALANDASAQFDADMKLILGRPAIAYIAYVGPFEIDLKYIRADDATGNAWPGSPTTWPVFSGNWSTHDVRPPCSLAQLGVYPAATAWDGVGGTGIFRLSWGNDGGPGTWTINRDVPQPGAYMAAGQLNSWSGGAMAGADLTNNMYPVVGWSDDIYDDNANWYTQTIEPLPDCQSFSWGGYCLQYDAGICYQDYDNQDLRFCGITGPNASHQLELAPQLVDGGDYIGYRCNMAVIDYVPCIAYEQLDFEFQPAAIYCAVMR